MVQLAWLALEVKVPEPQALHARSVVALPAVETKVPAAQVDQVAQLA